MDPLSPSLECIQNKLLHLEKQHSRLKALGGATLIALVSLLAMGQSASKKTVEANEFVLKDDSGTVRARLSLNVPVGAAPSSPAVARLDFFDEKGKKRIALDGGISSGGFSGLSLYDERGIARIQLFAMDMFGASLLISDAQGDLKTRLKEGEVMAADSVMGRQVQVFDAQGFSATLGVTELVTSTTGETHKTSAASLVLFDKNKNVIWRAP